MPMTVRAIIIFTMRVNVLNCLLYTSCAFHQRELTVAIKRARHVALLPYVSD